MLEMWERMGGMGMVIVEKLSNKEVVYIMGDDRIGRRRRILDRDSGVG